MSVDALRPLKVPDLSLFVFLIVPGVVLAVHGGVVLLLLVGSVVWRGESVPKSFLLVYDSFTSRVLIFILCRLYFITICSAIQTAFFHFLCLEVPGARRAALAIHAYPGWSFLSLYEVKARLLVWRCLFLFWQAFLGPVLTVHIPALFGQRTDNGNTRCTFFFGAFGGAKDTNPVNTEKLRRDRKRGTQNGCGVLFALLVFLVSLPAKVARYPWPDGN